MKARHLAALLLVYVLFVSSNAQAYVGPGAGLTAIGAFLALVGGMLLAVLGFIWYPIRRLLRALKRPAEKTETVAATSVAATKDGADPSV